MKNRVLIILSILVAASINAAAQYIPQNATLYYKAGNVYTTDGDVKLTKANALNYFSSLDDYESYWLKGKKLFTAGIVVSSIGAGLAIGGHLFDVINLKYFADFDPYMEMYIPIPSFAGWIFGLYWVGTVKLKKAAATGSAQSPAFEPELSFVTQSGGIGLAVNF